MVTSVWVLSLLAIGRPLALDLPANTYLESEPLRLTVGPGEAVALRLLSVDGQEIWRREVPAGETAVLVSLDPLPPGYYELVAGETMLPLVVLIGPERRVAGDSRLAVDNAMSWLVKPNQFVDTARILRRCGVGLVRERLSWGEVQRDPTGIDWGKYEQALAALQAEGIGVYQVFHSIPGWARADRNWKAAPDDLRVIHQFARELAAWGRGRMTAWEVWNEPDISFFTDTASEMAAFQKAAFLGFRAVAPEQVVLGPSIAHGACIFSDHLLGNDVGAYLDAWNYHIYDHPTAYAARVGGWDRQLAEHGLALPHWVTEAGCRIAGPEGVLAGPARRTQAAFCSRAFPLALAAGVERHFWFVFPFYREKDIGWGLFEPGGVAPFPGLAALSTVTWALGRGDYLGELTGLPEAGRALAFARGDGTVALAVWREADQPAALPLPIDAAVVTEARDHLGTPLALPAGPLAPSLGRAAVFYVLAADALPSERLSPPPPRELRRPAPPELLHLVPRLIVAGGSVDKSADASVVAPGAEVSLTAELYNFGDTAFAGQLELGVDGGWALSAPGEAVQVAPGERVQVTRTLTAPEGLSRAAVTLRAVAAAGASSRSVARLMTDPNLAVPRQRLDLGLDAPTRWLTNLAGHGKMTIAAVDGGGVGFTIAFRGSGDPWLYPQVRLDPPLDLSGYDGLRFEYRTSPAEMGTVRLMLVEQGGTSYFTSAGWPGSGEWRSVTAPFSAFTYLALSPPDANGKLDLDRIITVRVGANASVEDLALEVRKIEAVKF